MKFPINLHSISRKIAQVCALLVIFIGFSVFMGWLFDIRILRSLLPNFVEMKANTSVGYMWLGSSLLLLSLSRRTKLTDRIGYGLAFLAVILGSATLSQYIFNIDLGIDLLLFYEAPGALATSSPGRMAAATAVNFIFKGIALLILNWETKNGHRPSQYLSLLTLFAPTQALIAYAYGVQTLFGANHVLVTQMAVHAAFAWFLITIGTLFAIPDKGIMALATNNSYAGLTIRRLFLPGLVIPVILGFFLEIGFRRGYYDAGFGFATLALGSLVGYSCLVWWNAKQLLEMEISLNSALAKSESQILHLQKMEAIGRLAGGVAHDFNNILAVMGVYSETIYDALDPKSPLRNHAEQIKNSVARGAGLTRQLLAFSRQQMWQPVELDINALILNFEKMLRRLIGENIELVTQLSELPATIMADGGQIEQVIMNLAVNARDAMPNGGRLTINTSVVSLEEKLNSNGLEVLPGDYVLLNIVDVGSGMTKEVQQQIFEPFFTTKEQGKGTGLGLATVYGIVKKHSGAIWVYSEEGRGTSFKIYFPLARVKVVTKPAAPAAAEPSTTRMAKTILVAEDEELLREAVVMSLEGHGCDVTDAKDGVDALQKLDKKNGEVDLLITDMKMPIMGGAELAKHVKEKWPRIKILFLSGYVGEGRLDPKAHYIEKPFLPRDLINKVDSIFAEGAKSNLKAG